jgi:hypothetical protein
VHIVVAASGTDVDAVQVTNPAFVKARRGSIPIAPVHLRIVEQFDASTAAPASKAPQDAVTLQRFKLVRFAAVPTKW